MRTRTRDLAIVSLLLALCTFDAGAVQYSIVPVGPGGGGGINNYGDIAGNNAGHAFMWTYKTRSAQVVRTLGGSSSQASAINDCGEVVGSSLLAGDKIRHAFVWYQGYVSDLDPRGVSSVANAINNAGVIVGFSTVGTDTHPATFRPGKPLVIDSHGFPGAFTAISFSGAIAGYRIAPNRNFHSFLLEGGVLTRLSETPDDSFYDGDSPSGINDHGDVVGTLSPRYGISGFAVYHDDGHQTAVGTLVPPPNPDRTWAGAINDAGVIVGGSMVDFQNFHAFVRRAGRMEDLNTLLDPKDPLARYVILTGATGVNDSGWIVANGIDSRSGAQNVYLLMVKDPPIQLQRLKGACSHH